MFGAVVSNFHSRCSPSTAKSDGETDNGHWILREIADDVPSILDENNALAQICGIVSRHFGAIILIACKQSDGD